MSAVRFRWALRDLRARWIQLVGIAAIVAIGTGVFAGLSMADSWRFAAIDRSYEETDMYDLLFTTGVQTFPEGSFAAIAADVEGVDAYSERLWQTSVLSLETDEGPLTAASQIIGTDVSSGSRVVGKVVPFPAGSAAQPTTNKPSVFLERNFGRYHNLPGQMEAVLGGDKPVEIIGHAVEPGYFMVSESFGTFGSHNLGVVFASLPVAQELLDKPGQVSAIVVTVKPAYDAAEVSERFVEAAREQQISLAVVPRERVESYVEVTGSAEVARSVSTLLAIFLFVGAGVAALNFGGRLVQSQRREIGNAMALGAKPAQIAMRPITMGINIGVLGVLAGLPLGLWIAHLTADLLEEIQTLPYFDRPFEFLLFGRAAIVGLLVPILSVLLPVYRAVRVKPVDAIRTGHLASRGGLGPMLGRIPLPGSSLTRMPLRNLMRTPRRSLLTLVTFGTSLAILFGVTGLDSSLRGTVDRAQETAGQVDSEVVRIEFEGLETLESPNVGSVLGHAAVVGQPHWPEYTSTLEARDSDGSGQLGMIVSFRDFGNDPTVPAIIEGEMTSGTQGIALAAKAATDLGVEVGDRLEARHFALVGGEFSAVTSSIPVAAIHANPVRGFAYFDYGYLREWGLGGWISTLVTSLNEGNTLEDARAALLTADWGVSVVLPIGESLSATRAALDQSRGMTGIVTALTLALVLLIAFSNARINVEERDRDHATMLAYGVSPNRVVASLSGEALLLGLASVGLAAVFGYGVVTWLVLFLLPGWIPTIGTIVSIPWMTMTVYFAVALVAIAAAPMMAGRRLKRMYLPGALRTLE